MRTLHPLRFYALDALIAIKSGWMIVQHLTVKKEPIAPLNVHAYNSPDLHKPPTASEKQLGVVCLDTIWDF